MRGVKWFGLIISIIIIDIILFSPGLIGLEFGSDKLESTFVIMIWLISIVAVVGSTYLLLFQTKQSPVFIREMNSIEDYREHFMQFRNNKSLSREADLAIEQCNRLEKRKSSLSKALGDRFSPDELSYKRFAAVIVKVEKLFQSNIKGLLTKFQAFEASDISQYNNPTRNSFFSPKLNSQKNELFNQYMHAFQAYLGGNEEILLKLDQLLLEMSKLSSIDYDAIENLPCIKEIDSLISQTKYYK